MPPREVRLIAVGTVPRLNGKNWGGRCPRAGGQDLRTRELDVRGVEVARLRQPPRPLGSLISSSRSCCMMSTSDLLFNGPTAGTC